MGTLKDFVFVTLFLGLKVALIMIVGAIARLPEPRQTWAALAFLLSTVALSLAVSILDDRRRSS